MKLSVKVKKRLKEKYGDWAIVTGASSGIGLELATQLADTGFNLIINARNKDHLSETERLMQKKGVQVKSVVGDVSESEIIEKIIHAAMGLRVGLLVNNAGFGTSGMFADSSLYAEVNMLRVNCEAVLALTHHFLRQFKQHGKGGIIFLSSLVAFQGVPFAANYAATKAYIQSFAEALSQEMKPLGIDILAAAPGPVESGFGRRANMNMTKAIPPQKLGVPILKALGKQSNVIPGLFSKFLVYSLRMVPRFMKIKIMQKVMGGFIKHQLETK